MKDIDFLKIYSYSKLGTFEKCPKQYYFNYLDPEISPIKKYFRKQRDYQTKGSAVHGAITLFHHLPVKKRNFENLKECLFKAWFVESEPWQKPPLGEVGGFESLEHERKIYLESLILLRNFIKTEDINPPIFYLPTSKIKDSFEDYEGLIRPLNQDVSISGKFDRIDKIENNSLKIIDYKTGRNEQDEFQLFFYKLLAELNFENKVGLVSFYYLNNGTVKGFDVSSTDNKIIESQILGKVENIKKTQEFLPKPSGICHHCDFKDVCPKHRTLDEIKRKIEGVKNIVGKKEG